MRWRTSKSTPHCLAISHTCRASTSARPLRRANSAGRGTRLPAGSQKRQRSKSILHFTCLPLALTLTARCSWLSSSHQGALVRKVDVEVLWEPGNFQDDGAKRVGVCFASNTDLELWTEEVEQGVIDNMIIFQKPFPGTESSMDMNFPPLALV